MALVKVHTHEAGTGFAWGNGKASGEAGVESRGHWRRWSLTRPPRAPCACFRSSASAVVAPRTAATTL